MIFVDTGPLLARYLARDAKHTQAVSAFARLEHEKMRLATSNFVLDELFTLLGRRAGYDFAAARARAIYDSGVVRILRPSEREELTALSLFTKFADQKVSFTDCISFALMKEHRIDRALSFDRHFEVAGFAFV